MWASLEGIHNSGGPSSTFRSIVRGQHATQWSNAALPRHNKYNVWKLRQATNTSLLTYDMYVLLNNAQGSIFMDPLGVPLYGPPGWGGFLDCPLHELTHYT